MGTKRAFIDKCNAKDEMTHTISKAKGSVLYICELAASCTKTTCPHHDEHYPNEVWFEHHPSVRCSIYGMYCAFMEENFVRCIQVTAKGGK